MLGQRAGKHRESGKQSGNKATKPKPMEYTSNSGVAEGAANASVQFHGLSTNVEERSLLHRLVLDLSTCVKEPWTTSCVLFATPAWGPYGRRAL